MVTSCEVEDFGDVSLEAPPRGASDVVTGPVQDPAAVADREVAVVATSGGVAVAAISNEVTVGSGDLGEEAENHLNTANRI